MVGACFAYAGRTITSLYTVVRGRQWLENGSRWPIDATGKSMKTVTNGLPHVDSIKLPGMCPSDLAPIDGWIQQKVVFIF